jgi:phosphatidylinositol glycan class T
MGYGQERGAIGVDISNSLSDPVSVVYVEEWPWWIKVFLHTLTVTVDGNKRRKHRSEIQCFMTSELTDEIEELVGNINYVPARDRVRPALMEARVMIPPRSTVRLVIDFEKAHLRYTEHPPDANRGFDVPPAVIFLPDGKDSGGLRRMYTTSTLLSLPTPDFSMPYNVIILTSTCMALFFGSTFNLLTRQFVAVRPSKLPSADKAN